MTDVCPSCGESLTASAAWCDACGWRPDDDAPLPPPPSDEGASAPGALRSTSTPALPHQGGGSRTTRTPTLPSQGGGGRAAPMQPSLLAVPVAAPAPRAELPSDLEPYRKRLRETFGYPEFRDGQSRVLEGLSRGDVVAVMPTGSGKSLCYVLPALEVGRTIVVSPLIALMQDQVEGLQAAGVSATFINSNIAREEQNRRYREFLAGRIALLYVAPERFANASFTTGLAKAGVKLLAVDEAHCISEWGHNFRPDYLQLGTVRTRLGNPRTLALTATANPQVRRDIAQRLGLDVGVPGGASEVITTVDRPNLTYAVERIDGVPERRRWIIDYARDRPGLAGLVYARTRRGVEEMAEALRSAGVHAEAYHAGLPAAERSRVQRAFTIGSAPVIVATNAFGMGIDKPDVRYVLHMNMPGRLEAYYQEAGRAGRDGDPSECTLLYARADRRFQQQFIDAAHPDEAALRSTWQHWTRIADRDTGRLPFNVGDADPDQFAMIVAALRDSGLLDPVALAVTSFDPNAPIDATSVLHHRAYAEARLREMAEYAETTGCRRAAILRYFGEEAPEACGNCDNCLGRHADSGEGDTFPEDLYDDLIAIRERIAMRSDRDPFRVFENRTARELATYRPRDAAALLEIWGIGETRVRWFGSELLAAIEAWEREHPEAAPPPVPVAVQTARQSSSSSRNAGFEAGADVRPDDPLFMALRAWRSERARAEGVPAYALFSDRTLRELVAQHPTSLGALLRVWGLGESRVTRFGREILDVIRGVEA